MDSFSCVVKTCQRCGLDRGMRIVDIVCSMCANKLVTIVSDGKDRIAQLEAEIEELKIRNRDHIMCYETAIDRAEAAEAKAERLEGQRDVYWATANEQKTRAEAAEAEVALYGTKYKNSKRRADEAEAKAERYAGAIRDAEAIRDAPDVKGYCSFCGEKVARFGHATDCIKAEVDGLNEPK